MSDQEVGRLAGKIVEVVYEFNEDYDFTVIHETVEEHEQWEAERRLDLTHRLTKLLTGGK